MHRKIEKTYFLDYFILVPYLILSIVGILMVYSASSVNSQGLALEAIKQGGFFIVGLLAILFTYKMKTKVFQNKQFIMTAILTIGALLVLTKFTSLGVSGGGADGWLQIGPVRLQPVEFLKIIIIWYLAYILSRRQDMILGHFKDAIFKPMILIGSLIVLVLIQPDTGGAAILILIALVMVLASGIPYLYTLVVVGGGVVVSTLVIQFISLLGSSLFPQRMMYVYKRFKTFTNPFADPLGDGHQMINSYFALSNGGWFGLGLGKSIQKKGFLTNAQTDFMFSIVVEELGLFISLILLMLLFFLILRIMTIGIRSTDNFNSLMCIGIAGMMLIQVFVNLGGITGIIPLTGVTFPFLSQGGSSLVTLSIGVGFALNISADEKRKKFDNGKYSESQLLLMFN
ncbi:MULTISPECIES: FtsW/RodA/SpoVE family cell cycle protein [Vagococcus]|uniref:FtsW/RodA/SpoVE family cell cycle protein n=1 Tax=Vagococcus TaxID=2737 RepID=UPI0008F82155|nr:MULTISPECIES: FtsW/RodA/SpoVE family cell cycle protein [Vagococcus]RHH69520.1 FtsW/RodA/SpoVE family cell cycle protein [Vagococcus sp. AM17-17]